MTRRAWLTPNTPAPEGTRCRRVTVPDDLMFIGAVTGALIPLTQEENWEQFGSMTAAEAAGIMSIMFEDFAASDCEGLDCPPPNIAGTRIIRISPTTGKFEELADDSETWQEPTGDYAVPDIQARGESTEAERKCAAAANAVYVMHELYDESLALWDNAIAPLAAFEAFGELFGELANAVLTALLGAFAPFVGTVWGIWYATMEILTAESWTAEFESALTCLLEENTIYTDGVVTFDYQAIQRGLFSSDFLQSTYIVLLGQVSYLLSIIGADGLNLSGETTATTGDCSNCDEWCYEFDFLTDSGSFGNVTVYNESGSVFCGSGGGGTYTGAVGWTVTRAIGRNFTRSAITSLELEVVVGSGTGSPRSGIEIYDPQGGRAYDRDYRTVVQVNDTVGTQTITWAGSVMGSEISLIRCCSSGSSVYKRLRLTGTGVNPFGSDNC